MRTTFLYLAFFAIFAVIFVLTATLRFSAVPQDRFVNRLKQVAWPSSLQEPALPASLADESAWSYDYIRDHRNYGLSQEQCQTAFPLLSHEIDRAVEHRRKHKITLDEQDTVWRGDGIVRCMIWENQLYVIENRGVWDKNHRPRAVATLHAINRAVAAYVGVLPNIEFTFTVHDFPEVGAKSHTTWAFTRLAKQETLWLMPDFNTWAWPDVGMRSYPEVQTLIDDAALDFMDKKPQLVWRGSIAVGSKDVRTHLVSASAGHSWSDVKTLDWANASNIAESLLGMEDHCAYQFVAQTEGNTYSGRLKFLLACDSVLVSHPLRFLEPFHHLMRADGPEQNYVLVERDYADLQSTMQDLLDDQLKAQRIAANARLTFRERYLTPAAQACYWRQMIKGWGEVQGFKTQFWHDVEVEKAGVRSVVRRPRGVPYESYAIMEAVEWAIPAKPRKVSEYR